jgi:2-methylcitrate dehydratase PrpD
MINTDLKAYQEIQRFSDWAVSLTYDHLPESTIKKARLVLLDDIGAILGGSIAPEVAQFRDLSYIGTSSGESTILCLGFPKTNPILAAQLNGIAGCWEELDEGYRLATCHAGIYTVPTVLAIAEEMDAKMEEVIAALIVGYECGTRFAEAWKFPSLYLHPHGVFVTVASAAAGAKLKGYSAKEMTDAILTASAVTIASPFDQAIKGALVRNLWTGLGAASGITAFMAAKSGITGIPSTLESVFSDVYKAEFLPGAMTSLLGEKYAIDSGYHKLYACCQYAHSSIDALLELRKRNEIDILNIEKIEVKTHPKALSLHEVHPQTTLGAKFSLPHIMSTVWFNGTAGRESFTNETINHPRISTLRENTHLKEMRKISPPYDRPAEVTVFFTNGKFDSELMMCATGDPQKPMSTEMIVNKFKDTVSVVLNNPNEVADFILESDVNKSIRTLFSLLKETEGIL